MLLYHMKRGQPVGQPYKTQIVVRITMEQAAVLEQMRQEGGWCSTNKLLESIIAEVTFDEDQKKLANQ